MGSKIPRNRCCRLRVLAIRGCCLGLEGQLVDLAAKVARQEVAIDLGGDPGVAVAKDPLHRGRVRSGHQEQRTGRVAQVVEPNRPNLGLGPELHSVDRAVAKLGILCRVPVAAAFLATNMNIRGDDARMGKGPSQDFFERRMPGQHGAIRVRKNEI